MQTLHSSLVNGGSTSASASPVLLWISSEEPGLFLSVAIRLGCMVTPVKPLHPTEARPQYNRKLWTCMASAVDGFEIRSEITESHRAQQTTNVHHSRLPILRILMVQSIQCHLEYVLHANKFRKCLLFAFFMETTHPHLSIRLGCPVCRVRAVSVVHAWAKIVFPYSASPLLGFRLSLCKQCTPR